MIEKKQHDLKGVNVKDRIYGRLGLIILLTLLLLILPLRAYAYLDPGTASYILQLILGGLLVGSLAVKIFWGKIKIIYKKLFSRWQT